MAKKSFAPTNDLCPQTLFTYGTYKEDGTPNFGLFCWFSYCWMEELSVMCCIGANKQTQARIRANGVFSANLVTESNLPLSDYFGTADGDDPDKMAIDFAWEKGQVLNVPVLTDCPLSFELEVVNTIDLNDEGAVMFVCRIRNVLKDETCLDASEPAALYHRVGAVQTSIDTCYFSSDGRYLGRWHEPAQKIKPGVEVGAAAKR